MCCTDRLIPDFFPWLTCFYPPGDTVLIHVHLGNGQGLWSRTGCVEQQAQFIPKMVGNFFQCLPSYDLADWQKGLCAVTFQAKQALLRFSFSGVLEQVLGALTVFSCFYFQLGIRCWYGNGDSASLMPLYRGYSMGRSGAGVVGKQNLHWLMYKEPQKKGKEKFLWAVMTGACTVVCFLSQIIFLLF